MTSPTFTELPKKALQQIFSSFEEPERQKLREVCLLWKNYLDENFPLEVIINQGNFERIFKCSNIGVAEIQNLTTEYTENVAFGPRLRSIQFSGKVLSSNIFSILRFCPDLETLSFSSLKQVLGIEGTESVKLPKATIVEIKVRPDQETFTSDEIIIINALKQIVFGSLESILISTASPYESWEDDEDEVDYNPSELSESEGGETQSFTMSMITPMSSTSAAIEVEVIPFTLEQDQENAEPLEPISDSVIEAVVGENLPQLPGTNNGEPQTAATQTANTNANLHVIINRAANFPDASGSQAATTPSHATTRSSSSRRMRYNISDFEARLFHANLELLMGDDQRSNELSVFNDSISRNTMNSTIFFEAPGMNLPAIKHTVFFEFVRNNHSTLKNLYVRTRSDFMCFGNLSGFVRDLPKVQFEEVDYSFGRMTLCYEHVLLRTQNKLTKLKMQILDDLWKHLIQAVRNCQETLTDLDIKVLSVSEERVDITPITNCSNLKNLKLLHFFEKESMCRLPKSLNRLVLNGPVSYHDMETWANELALLEEFTLLLNTRGEKIDVALFKKFLKMPNLSKLTLIQCPMDLDAIKEYVDHIPQKGGLKFWINGPREMRDMPMIQYVYTSISRSHFNREQIEI